MANTLNRRGCTHQEAVKTLQGWIRERRMSQADFVRWLSDRGITITQVYLSNMLTGKRPPGPKFREMFREIAGITLVDGLVEQDEQPTGGKA